MMWGHHYLRGLSVTEVLFYSIRLYFKVIVDFGGKGYKGLTMVV